MDPPNFSELTKEQKSKKSKLKRDLSMYVLLQESTKVKDVPQILQLFHKFKNVKIIQNTQLITNSPAQEKIKAAIRDCKAFNQGNIAQLKKVMSQLLEEMPLSYCSYPNVLKLSLMNDDPNGSTSSQNFECLILPMNEKSTKGTEIDLIKHLNNCIEQDLIDAIIMKGQRMASKYSKGEPLEKKMKMTEDLPEKGKLSKPNETYKVFKTQKTVGHSIFEKIKSKMEIKKFDGAKALILLPGNQTALQTQTEERMKAAIEHYNNKFDFGINPLNPESIHVVRLVCVKGSPSKKFKHIWSSFLDSSDKNPNIFHLVVHDECHWAAGKTQSCSKLLFKDGKDYHLKEGKLKLNLFTLMVSATPYNFFPDAAIDKSDIVIWRQELRSKNVKCEYKSLSELRNDVKIKSESSSTSMDSQMDCFVAQTQNGFSKAFICVLSQYVEAIFSLQQNLNPISNHVSKYVEDCYKKNKLIVIRIGSAFNGSSQICVAQKVLCEAIKRSELNI